MTQTNVTANSTYKARIFEMVFSDRKELLALYNAVNGTCYTDPEKLENTFGCSAGYSSVLSALIGKSMDDSLEKQLIQEYGCDEQASYQPFVFFPHIFISLILSIGAAVINALMNRRWIKEKFFYVPITVLGGVLLMLYSVYGILVADNKGLYLLLPIFLFMLLIMIYELIQGILHAIAGHIFS